MSGCETVMLSQAVTTYCFLTGKGFIITDITVYLLTIPDIPDKEQDSINLPTGPSACFTVNHSDRPLD